MRMFVHMQIYMNKYICIYSLSTCIFFGYAIFLLALINYFITSFQTILEHFKHIQSNTKAKKKIKKIISSY